MSRPPTAPRRHRQLAAQAAAVALTTLCAGPAPAQAPDAQTERLRLRALAATCAHCHGTDGHALEGQATVRLAGLPEDYVLTQLLAFRSGQRPATIMHQITKGYSQEQLEALARYFASQK